MRNYYSIDETLLRFLDMAYGEVDVETGVVCDEKSIDALEMDWRAKAEGRLLYAEEKEADAKRLEARIAVLKEQVQRLKKAAVDNRKAVADSMSQLGEKKLEGNYLRATWYETKATIVDESVLPAEYFIEKIERRVDTSRIKELLNSGAEIPGAKLQTNNNLRIK